MFARSDGRWQHDAASIPDAGPRLYGFSLLDLISFGWIVAAWAGYGAFMEWSAWRDGIFALLRSTEDVMKVFATLPVGIETTVAVWEIKVLGLLVIFNYAFFKFPGPTGCSTTPRS